MAYVGVGGQFDGGLTNPSRKPGGRFSYLGFGQPKPGETPPLRPSGRVSPASGGPQGSMGQDQYWPWQMPAAQPQAPVDHGFIAPGSKAKPQKTNTVAPFIPAPEFPGQAPNPNPIVGAPAAEYMKYNPSYWKEPDIAIPEAGVDTRAIVDSTKHFLDEEMAGGMGDAARRFGALGGLRGTGYEETLGNVQRKRDADLAAEYYKWDYNAAQSDADRKSRAREGTLGRAYSGWDAEQGRIFGDLANNNDFNLKQQQIANDIAKANQGNEQFIASETNNYGLDKYGAGLSEAERKQMYDQLKLQFGG